MQFQLVVIGQEEDVCSEDHPPARGRRHVKGFKLSTAGLDSEVYNNGKALLAIKVGFYPLQMCRYMAN